MLPLSRRRARRRSISRRLIAALVAAVLLLLIIGGFMRINRQSHSYDEGANRSLVAQGGVLARESNTTGTQVTQLFVAMPSLDRRTLQARLDGVVHQTTVQSDQATQAATGSAASPYAHALATVFANRAAAVLDLRAAVDGMLGMHPLPVAGALGSTASTATPTLLTATQTTNRIAAAGTLLSHADGEYQRVRHGLRLAPGHARLPASTWVTNPQTWEIGAVAAQVDLVATSSSLAVVHELDLQTVRLDPPALPTATSTAQGISVLSPTTTISVTVVLRNLGTVDEPRAAVTFSLAPLTGSAVSVVRQAAVGVGGSVTLDTVTFNVVPGHTYQLTVAITSPTGLATTNGTVATQQLQIAPGT